MTTETVPTTTRTECAAIIAYAGGDYGFVPVICRQTVAVRHFVTTTGLRVGFCSIPSHERNVRRRFAERVAEPPEPRWLHEDPDYTEWADFVDHSPDASYWTEGTST